jgi:hypothetical protein
LRQSNYGNFLFYLKDAAPPAPRRRKGDEVEAMAAPSRDSSAPAGEQGAAIIGYVIEAPDRHALHFYADCPALERSDLPLRELELPDTGDVISAAARVGLEACRVCLQQLAREPLEVFEVEGGGFWSGGDFFLRIHDDCVELVKVPRDGLAAATRIFGDQWRDIRISANRITRLQPGGGGLLSAVSPPTLRIESDTEDEWIQCTFADTEARDAAVSLLRQISRARK